MRAINSTSRHNSRRKKIFLGIILLLVLIGAILYYTEANHITNLFNLYKSPQTNLSPQQKEDATKNDPTTSTSSKADSQPSSGVSQSQTTNQVPISTAVSIAITTLNQSSGSVNITAIITNPAASGACTATFTKSGAKPVTRTINTTTGTCSTSIPELEFSMVGDWQVQVIYFSNNTQTSTTGVITIK